MEQTQVVKDAKVQVDGENKSGIKQIHVEIGKQTLKAEMKKNELLGIETTKLRASM